MSPPVRAHLISLSLVLGLTVSLVWGQAPTHFTLRGVTVSGSLPITSVGIGDRESPSLLCHTTNAANSVWLFPNGTEITRRLTDVLPTESDTFIYIASISPTTNFIRLRRENSVRSPGGEYCCVSATNVNERLCINLVVDCETPPSISNGYPGTPTSTLLGGTVTYTCDNGYGIFPGISVTKVFCLATGNWKNVPTCSENFQQPLPIRLVNNVSAISNEGRVEVFIHGQWGTVCDDFWGTLDAQVVCRQLGFPSDGALSMGQAHYGQGVGPIVLDNVQCTGLEAYLTDCPSSGLYIHDCFHAEDAGVRCRFVDCGLPPSISNGFHGTPTRTLFGGTVTYTCNSGYHISAGVTMTTASCLDTGYWETVTCLVIDCGPLNSLSHGSVVVSSGTLFNSLAMYSCNLGYRLDGNFRQLCGLEGIWLPPPPTCEIVECGPLSHPNHGRVNTDSGTTFNSTATYTCDVGYRMVGNDSTVCQHDGLWSARAPVCNPVNCGPLTHPYNGNVITSGGTTFGDRATYSCNNGYLLRGPMTRACDSDGLWTLTEPHCDPVDCGPPLVNGNGQVDTKFGTTLGNTATYSCVVGYNLHGVVNRTCNHDGQWNPEAPLCIIVDCGPVPSIEKGSVETSSGTKYNSTATYTCIEGYMLVDEYQIHCSSNGAWSRQAPSCVPVDCGPPDVPRNGAVDTTSGTYFGNTVTYSCDIGYNLTGNVTRICQSNGEWSVSAPYCADIALVQLKFSPTSHCVEWSNTRAELMFKIIQGSILKAITEKGDFSITLDEIGKGFFSCYRSKTETTYRTTITGLRDVSARTDLARPIQKWVESGSTLRVLWFVIKVDKSCPVLISSMDDDECE